MSNCGTNLGLAVLTIVGGLALAGSGEAQPSLPSQPMVVVAPVASVFSCPSNDAERVTQVLLNDEVLCLARKGPWLKVVVPSQYSTPQGYPGWMLGRHLVPAVGGRSPRLVSVKVPGAPVFARVAPSSAAAADNSSNLAASELVRVLIAPMGARLTLQGREGAWCRVALPGRQGSFFVAANQVVEGYLARDGWAVIDTAKMFMRVPYVWGGMSSLGIDCSGFVYVCYRVHGCLLPRDGDQQSQVGTPVTRAALQPGDLVFFGPNPKKVTHVGLALGEDKLLDASGKYGVAIHALSEERYAGAFLGARRVFVR